MHKLFITLFIYFFIVGASFAQSGSSDVLRMVYIENYPPLSWKKDKVVTGISIDVLTEALQNRMGIKVSHMVYPWKRAQSMVKKGKAEGLITLPTDARRAYAKVCKETVFSANFTLFANTNNSRINQLKKIRRIDELKEFKIGHILGSGWAEKNLIDLNVQWVSNVESNLRKIAKGRIDATIYNTFVGNWTIKKLGLKNQVMEIPEAALRLIPYHLMINKNSKFVEILPKFDKTIKEMKNDGTLDRIFTKYK